MLVFATGLVRFTIGDSEVAFLATGVRFSGGGACEVLFLTTEETELELREGEVELTETGTVVLDAASLDLLVGLVEVTLGMM